MFVHDRTAIIWIRYLRGYEYSALETQFVSSLEKSMARYEENEITEDVVASLAHSGTAKIRKSIRNATWRFVLFSVERTTNLT